MRRTRFHTDPCPIARTTDLIGDCWTPVVLREAFFGCKRFEEFHERLTISRATLTERLARLVDEGMFERREYQSNPPRHEYVLTDKGSSFFDVLAAMWTWGDRWMFDGNGAGVELSDRETRVPIKPEVVDANTGAPIDLNRVRVGRKR